MLRGEPVIRDDDTGPGTVGQGADQRPVAERRAGHVPAAVQVQQGSGFLGLAREQETRHSPGVHRSHADGRGRLEPPVQALERDPQFLQVARSDLGEGLPVPGDAREQFPADRAGRADRLVDLAQQAPGPVQQRLARERELDAVRGPPQQVAADQPLQAADLAAQRGLRQVETGGGAAEVQLVGHRDERAQVTQFYGVGRLRQRHDLGVLVHGSIIARRADSWSCRSCTTVMHTQPFPSRWCRCQRVQRVPQPDRRPAAQGQHQPAAGARLLAWPGGVAAGPAAGVLHRRRRCGSASGDDVPEPQRGPWPGGAGRVLPDGRAGRNDRAGMGR
jgi:hypothetical protein